MEFISVNSLSHRRNKNTAKLKLSNFSGLLQLIKSTENIRNHLFKKNYKPW